MFLLRLFILLSLTFCSYSLIIIPNEQLSSLGYAFSMSFFFFLPTLYFYPTIEAALQKRENFNEIFELNFLWGWTVFYWLEALSKAASKSSNKNTAIQTNTSSQISPSSLSTLNNKITKADDNMNYKSLCFSDKHPYIPTKFIALDVETTGLYAGIDKIIEIAAIKFDLTSNTHPVFETLVNPGVKVSSFITSLTGISNQMLEGSTSFPAIAKNLKDFIGDLPIVAYNADFDSEFLSAELAYAGFSLDNHFHCAMKLSKRAFNLPNYKLATVAEHCKIPLDEAHRAKADAMAAGRVFMCAAVTLGHINEIKPKPAFVKPIRVDHKTYPPNKNGELYGQTIVFTGELSITRADAFKAAAELGLEIKTGVSKKTNYLVVGTQDRKHVGSDGISSKQLKAQELIDKGAEIKILDKNAFMNLIS